LDDFSSNVLHIRKLKFWEALSLDSSTISILLNLIDAASGVDVFLDVLVCRNALERLLFIGVWG